MWKNVCMYILPCYDVHTLLSRAEVMELEATITEGQNWSAVYYHTHTLLSFTLVNRLTQCARTDLKKMFLPKQVYPLWSGLVILIWKLFSMSGYRKYINGNWFWHRNLNFGLKKSWKAKKGHKGQWRPAKAKKVQKSKKL